MSLSEIPTSVIMSYIQILDLAMNGMDQLYQQIENESKNEKTNMRPSFMEETEKDFNVRMQKNTEVIESLHKELDKRIIKSLGKVTTMSHVQRTYVDFRKSLEKPIFKKLTKK